MSRALRRSIQKAAKTRAEDMASVLEEGAARRQTIHPDDLMIVGGRKLDLSKSYDQVPDDLADSFLPRFISLGGGKILDLDAVDPDGPDDPNEGIITSHDSIDIDGRTIEIGEFGDTAAGHVVEQYELFLSACQYGWHSEFRKRDGTGDIIEAVSEKDHEAKRMLLQRIGPDLEPVFYVDWGNPHVTFDQWMKWAAATLRWRIRTDLKERYEHQRDIRRRRDAKTSSEVLEVVLIAVEKYLALPDRKRLTAV